MIAPITIGTALTSVANSVESLGTRLPVASRRNDTATGVSPIVRRRVVASESFGRRRSSRSTQSFDREVGMEVEGDGTTAVSIDGVADRR